MACRIDRVSTDQGLVLRISGRISRDDVDVLRIAIEGGSVIAVELSELELIDRDALRLLTIYEMNGMELRHCPAYIREWIVKERTNG